MSIEHLCTFIVFLASFDSCVYASFLWIGGQGGVNLVQLPPLGEQCYLTHLLGGPTVEKVHTSHDSPNFVPWQTEVKKVHLITKLLTKSRIWFLKCFTWLSLVPWEHNYSLNRFTYSTVDGHQYGKYNSPRIHSVIAKIWISIGKQSSEKFPVYVYPGKLWRLLS